MTNTILGTILLTPAYAPEGAAAPAPDPAAQTPVAPATDDDNYEEEEVEIPGDEGDGEPNEDEPSAAGTVEPVAAPPKKRGPKRYAELNRRVTEATSWAEQVARENADLKRQRDEALASAKQSSEVAMKTYEVNAKTNLAAAKKAHTEAQASGDASAITEAAEALASARATWDDVEAFNRNKPPEPDPKTAAAQPQPQQQEAPALPPDVKDFIMEHRWFDAVQRDAQGRPLVDRATGQFAGNPDFDQDMHAEAVLYSQKLARKIARGELNFKVSSPEYFNDVLGHMQEEFPDYFEDEDAPAARPAAPTKRGSPVAGPGSRALPGSGANKGGKSYKLSSDEIRFITKSHANGGGPKYPKGHPQQFKPMSLQDAKVSFARRKLSEAKSGNQ